MDEEYDVIVLGTGLTVSAALGAWGFASPPASRGAAGPGRPRHPPLTAIRRAAAPGVVVPERAAPCPSLPATSLLPTAVGSSPRRCPFPGCTLDFLVPTPSSPRLPHPGLLGQKTHPRSFGPIPPAPPYLLPSCANVDGVEVQGSLVWGAHQGGPSSCLPGFLWGRRPRECSRRSSSRR